MGILFAAMLWCLAGVGLVAIGFRARTVAMVGAWWLGVALVGGLIGAAVFDRDPAWGDFYECRLKSGYRMQAVDTLARGDLISPRRESASLHRVGRLMVSGRWIFAEAASPTGAVNHFVVDTATGVQEEVPGPDELAAAARARGVTLKLDPFATVFERERYQWFDAVLLMTAILPPVAWWWRRRRAVVVLLMATAGCSEETVVSGRRNGLGNFDLRTDRFVWWAGEVTLPPLFWRHVLLPGDSFEGVFLGTSDRKLDLDHDIGGYAGAWAHPKDALRFEERRKDGARIWLAQRWSGPPDNRQFEMAVTFPDSGCANFYLNTTHERDWDIIDAIARSYRPLGEIRKSQCGR